METEEIDLRYYIEVLWKWRWVIVFLTGMSILTSAIFSFFVLNPVYETKVTLLVANAAQNQQSIGPSGDTSVVETVSRLPIMTLNTYMNQITNPYFMKKVIDAVGLKDMQPSSLARMVSAQILKDTNLIEVRVQNTDKALATKIANTIASEFVVFVSQANQERMAKSLAFLMEQKEALRKELESAYAELKKTQTRGDNSVSLARDIATKTQVLTRAREDLVTAQLRRTLLEAGLKQIETDLATTPSTIPGQSQTTQVPNPVYQDLLQAKSEKTIELAETDAQIDALQREVASLETSLAAMEARLTVVKNEEDKQRVNVKRLEDTLSLLDAKMVEAQMAQSINFGEATISVISPALEPDSPVKPRKTLNMAVAGVLGWFVSLLLAFILEYLDNTIKTQEDVQKHLNLGTLGAIPIIEQPRATRKRAPSGGGA